MTPLLLPRIFIAWTLAPFFYVLGQLLLLGVI